MSPTKRVQKETAEQQRDRALAIANQTRFKAARVLDQLRADGDLRAVLFHPDAGSVRVERVLRNVPWYRGRLPHDEPKKRAASAGNKRLHIANRVLIAGRCDPRILDRKLDDLTKRQKEQLARDYERWRETQPPIREGRRA